VKPEEFAQLADLLARPEAPCPDASVRSSASRYYYSVFLEARDELKEKRGLRFLKKHDVHKCVREAFEFAKGDKSLKLIGRCLGDLKQLREHADYDIDVAFSPGDLHDAKDLCTRIRNSLSSADLSKCVDPLCRS